MLLTLLSCFSKQGWSLFCSYAIVAIQLCTWWYNESVTDPRFYALSWQVWILCNDCGKNSHVQFHLVAQKCLNCKSYNTRQIRGWTHADYVYLLISLNDFSLHSYEDSGYPFASVALNMMEMHELSGNFNYKL